MVQTDPKLIEAVKEIKRLNRSIQESLKVIAEFEKEHGKVTIGEEKKTLGDNFIDIGHEIEMKCKDSTYPLDYQELLDGFQRLESSTKQKLKTIKERFDKETFNIGDSETEPAWKIIQNRLKIIIKEEAGERLIQ